MPLLALVPRVVQVRLQVAEQRAEVLAPERERAQEPGQPEPGLGALPQAQAERPSEAQEPLSVQALPVVAELEVAQIVAPSIVTAAPPALAFRRPESSS